MAFGQPVPAALLPQPGQCLARQCNSAGAVRLLELDTGRPGPARRGSIPTGPRRLVFSPDNRLLASCGGDMLVCVWELPGLHQRFAIQHQNVVAVARFSPDGRRFATGDRDGDARVWDSVTGKPVSPLLNHGEEVSTLAFSPGDARILLTGGRNSLVRAWDAATGEPLGPPWRLSQMPARGIPARRTPDIDPSMEGGTGTLGHRRRPARRCRVAAASPRAVRPPYRRDRLCRPAHGCRAGRNLGRAASPPARGNRGAGRPGAPGNRAK